MRCWGGSGADPGPGERRGCVLWKAALRSGVVSFFFTTEPYRIKKWEIDARDGAVIKEATKCRERKARMLTERLWVGEAALLPAHSRVRGALLEPRCVPQGRAGGPGGL